jgi:hypothetical protein
LAEGAPWVHHLLMQMYASIAKALAANKTILMESSPEFKDIIQSLSTGSFACLSNSQMKHISFALKRAGRLVHHSKIKYFISKNMRLEIEFFRDKLNPRSDILWERILPTLYLACLRLFPTETVHSRAWVATLGSQILVEFINPRRSPTSYPTAQTRQ